MIENEPYDINQSALLADFTTCLNHYRLYTPGLYVCVHPQVQIKPETRVVPALIAQVNSGPFKQCDPGDEKGPYDHFAGPPNLVFDVFRKGQEPAYESRRLLFEQAGVIEYVAWFVRSRLPLWNRLSNGNFQGVEEDVDGVIQSTALPGLWLPVDALAHRDMWVLLARITQGVTRREHHDFMGTLLRK